MLAANSASLERPKRVCSSRPQDPQYYFGRVRWTSCPGTTYETGPSLDPAVAREGRARARAARARIMELLGLVMRAPLQPPAEH